jgi:hypothetical protein
MTLVTSGNGRLASRLEHTKFLTAFYTHVYHIQAMSFLHQVQLFRQAQQGQPPPIVIKAICGLSALYHAVVSLKGDECERMARRTKDAST